MNFPAPGIHARNAAFLALTLLSLLLIPADTSYGQQDRFWSATVGGSYFDAANWGGILPQPLDNVFFTNGSNTAVTWDQDYSSGNFIVGDDNRHTFYGTTATTHQHNIIGQFLVEGEANIGQQIGGTINFNAGAATVIDGGRLEIASTSELTTTNLFVQNSGVLWQIQQSDLILSGELRVSDARVDLLGGTTNVTGLMDFDAGLLRVENDLTSRGANFENSQVVVQGNSNWDTQGDGINFRNSVVNVGADSTIEAGNINADGSNVRVVFGDTKVNAAGTITGGDWTIEASGEVEADRIDSANFFVDGTDSKLLIRGDANGASSSTSFLQISDGGLVEATGDDTLRLSGVSSIDNGTFRSFQSGGPSPGHRLELTGDMTLTSGQLLLDDLFVEQFATLDADSSSIIGAVNIYVGGNTSSGGGEIRSDWIINAQDDIHVGQTHDGLLSGDLINADNMFVGTGQGQGDVTFRRLSIREDLLHIGANGTVSTNALPGTGSQLNATSGSIVIDNGGRLTLENTDIFTNSIELDGLLELREINLSVEGQVNIHDNGVIQIGYTGSATTATFRDDVVDTSVVPNTRHLDVAEDSVAVMQGSYNGGALGTGTVRIEGTLTPGNSPATVEFAGDLDFGTDATTIIELGGLGVFDFDRILVAGDLTLDGDLDVNLINGHALGAFEEYLIFEVDGLAPGQFNSLAEGSQVGLFGNQELFISYTAGDGNDVALFTIAAVPEPTSTVALLLCAAMALTRRHRRSEC